MKVSPGFRNMGCGTIAILIVLGIVFFFFAFFIAGPISFFVSDLLGGNTIVQRVVMYTLFGLYFLFVYYLMTYLKQKGINNKTDKY